MKKEIFMGSVEHQLDDKNRLRIPSKFKKMLVGEDGHKTYSFFRGKNGCIFVMDDETLKNKLSYTGEALGDSKWRTNANYDSSYVYVAPISNLDLSAQDAFVIYAESMPSNSNYIETTYSVDFDFFVGNKGFSTDVLFGFGFHLDSESQRLDEYKLIIP